MRESARFDVLLPGNNLAVMVAALELAEGGSQVLLASDGKPLGGHFAGLTLDGHAFDIGMVFMEKGCPITQASDPRTYDPQRRNDCARFFGLVGEFLDSLVESRRIPCMEVRQGGRRYPDFILSNRLDFLAGQPHRETLLGELESASPRADEHASNKVAHPHFDQLDYASASRFNHGDTLHETCFEPLCRKILGVSGERLLARYHRLGWLPLYYPETLAQYLREGASGLAEYPYWTTAEGFVGSLVTRLRARLAAHPRVRLLERPLRGLRRQGDRVALEDDQGQVHHGTQLAVGLAADRLAQLCSLPRPAPREGVSLVVVLGLVRREDIVNAIGCLLVADTEHATYRVTDQDAVAGLDPEWHRISIEANLAACRERYSDTEDHSLALGEELKALGVLAQGARLRVLKTLVARNALPLPTPELLAAPACPAGLDELLPGAELTGSLLGFSVASMNDQIIQGLRIARLWTADPLPSEQQA
ncbi:hypothetical protein LMK08_19975 [Metapseudomonas furukawaii]|uniref:hypothetical protein n=1 Tax=Metapseudomonas furukawaii TaxID=1149133 RepID=UPI00227BB469|nr:hypothetical protein [Pseudomonas furukawaii]WAG77620.1 hypothetical protein LMK08_19975 [Pseudomonas furukawaii]